MARSSKKWSALAGLLFLLPNHSVFADCLLVPTTHWDWRGEVGPLKIGIIETDRIVEGEMDDHIDAHHRQVMLFIEPQSIMLPCSLAQLSGIVALASLAGAASLMIAFSKRNRSAANF